MVVVNCLLPKVTKEHYADIIVDFGSTLNALNSVQVILISCTFLIPPAYVVNAGHKMLMFYVSFI